MTAAMIVEPTAIVALKIGNIVDRQTVGADAEWPAKGSGGGDINEGK